MIELLIYIVILVIIAIFLWWLLQQIPLPEPLMKIAVIVLVAIGIIALISILLSFPSGGFRIPR